MLNKLLKCSNFSCVLLYYYITYGAYIENKIELEIALKVFFPMKCLM